MWILLTYVTFSVKIVLEKEVKYGNFGSDQELGLVQ